MKKLLTILSGISIISAPVSYVTSCYGPPKNDSDYYIPDLSDQPKNIEEIIELAGNAEDKFQEYREIYEQKLNLYIKSIENWSDLSENEKNEHRIFFSHNSIENQKTWIYNVWSVTYNYKIYQFDNTFYKNLISPNGHNIRLKAISLEIYTSSMTNFLNNKYISNNTKEHIKKIQTWGIQENPNANK